VRSVQREEYHEISQGADKVPISSHKLVKLSKRGIYIYYKGLRFKDRPKNGLH
jgi:hypothetical protein